MFSRVNNTNGYHYIKGYRNCLSSTIMRDDGREIPQYITMATLALCQSDVWLYMEKLAIPYTGRAMSYTLIRQMHV